MLTNKEIEISKIMQIPISQEKEIEEVISLEKEYNKNSLEILHLKENLSSDFIRWQLLVEKLIYFNSGFYKINKINDIKYITYNKRMEKKKFSEYLDLVKKYQTKNPNIIFVLSNNASYYKKILSGLNHRGITTLFITDNKEDIHLDYSNTIIQYTTDIRAYVKKLKLYEFAIDLGDEY